MLHAMKNTKPPLYTERIQEQPSETIRLSELMNDQPNVRDGRQNYQSIEVDPPSDLDPHGLSVNHIIESDDGYDHFFEDEPPIVELDDEHHMLDIASDKFEVEDEHHMLDIASDKFEVEDVQHHPPSDKPSIDTNFSIGYEHQRSFDMSALKNKLSDRRRRDPVHVRPTEFNLNWMYTKGLPHNDQGKVNADAMGELITGLQTRDRSMIHWPHLVNPSAAWSNDLIGKCSNAYRYSKFPSINSPSMIQDMVELYGMSICRDIPFYQFDSHPLIKTCADKMKVDHDGLLFRGLMYGDLHGPYISQFLYRDIHFGSTIQPQKYVSSIEHHDFMTTVSSAVRVQNNTGIPTPSVRSRPRYIITGRDLAWYGRSDELYLPFLNTCNILHRLGVPVKHKIREQGYVDLGIPDIHSILTLVGRNALLAAWYVKWNLLAIRPEAYGIKIQLKQPDLKILEHPMIKLVRSQTKSRLLSQAYPEGAPLHPSYPSHQAVVAGACVTVLKFFFDIKYELEVYEPTADGSGLRNSHQLTTVGDELDKLATNIAFSGMWSGTQFRIDCIAGLKRGEKVAIACLNDIVHRYPFPVDVSIKRFNEQSSRITNTDV